MSLLCNRADKVYLYPHKINSSAATYKRCRGEGLQGGRERLRNSSPSPLAKKKINKSVRIEGLNASYDPRFYFISKGAIYLRAGFEEAYKNGFNYKFVDIVRDF